MNLYELLGSTLAESRHIALKMIFKVNHKPLDIFVAMVT